MSISIVEMRETDCREDPNAVETAEVPRVGCHNSPNTGSRKRPRTPETMNTASNLLKRLINGDTKESPEEKAARELREAKDEEERIEKVRSENWVDVEMPAGGSPVAKGGTIVTIRRHDKTGANSYKLFGPISESSSVRWNQVLQEILQQVDLPWEVIWKRMEEVAADGKIPSENPGLQLPHPDVMTLYKQGSKMPAVKDWPPGTHSFMFKEDRGKNPIQVYILYNLCFTCPTALKRFHRRWDTDESGLPLATLAALIGSVRVSYGPNPVADLPLAVSTSRLVADPRPRPQQVFTAGVARADGPGLARNVS